MKILIVHDRIDVLDQIEKVVLEACQPDVKIDRATCYVGATDFMRSNLYDLVILDLTLPHIDGRDPSYHIAQNLLHELFDEATTFHTPGDIIGITKDADALEIIRTEIQNYLFSIIDEDAAGVWQQKLREKTSYVKKVQRDRYKVALSTYDYDAAIICALDEELEPFKKIFELHEIPGSSRAYKFLYTNNGHAYRGVISSIGRAGAAAAGGFTQAVISQFRPKICIMSGICGAAEKKLKLGEVYIFENIFDWDYGKWNEGANGSVFESRPEPINIRNTNLHKFAREIVMEKNPLPKNLKNKYAHKLDLGDNINIKKGPAACGSSVIADEKKLKSIVELNGDIAAVDMESYAFYYAAHHSPFCKPDYICIKTGCDYCNSKKNDNYHDVASDFSAYIVKEFLTRASH